MADKLTDNEIMESFKACVFSGDDANQHVCPSCPYFKHQDCTELLVQDVFNIINRLEAEKSNLKETLDRVIGEVKGLRETNKELQAENERLKEENQEQDQAVLNALRRTRKIRLDAYKEFAELLHCQCESIINQPHNEKVKPLSWKVAYEEFDKNVNNLLKEMVGEDNG